jgi:dihydroorotate dehydrogenase electron transfer subunit
MSGDPVQVRGQVLSVKRVGAYSQLSLVADGIAENTRPGHFVALGVGGEHSSMLLRRSFSIYRVRPRGAYGGTVEVVFAVTGKGTAWLAGLDKNDVVDVVGPLGRPFGLPQEPVPCVLVGGGYGSAPLFTLAERLRARGCGVHMVLGAATHDRVFGALEAKRAAQSVVVTTEDGSVGVRGRVTDVLPELIRRVGAAVVYSCGPMGMLAAVTAVATQNGAWSQTAVEESMACGIGVCMTCVLPVVGDDGITRMVRSCVEGPVFRGDRVRWDAVGTIPAGTAGAPAGAR